jgi:hypothetical protein
MLPLDPRVFVGRQADISLRQHQSDAIANAVKMMAIDGHAQ